MNPQPPYYTKSSVPEASAREASLPDAPPTIPIKQQGASEEPIIYHFGQQNTEQGTTKSDSAPPPSSASGIVLGHVTFDGSNRSNASCDVLILAAQANHFHRDVYVGIRDTEQEIEFLGRIVAGPFFAPRSVKNTTNHETNEESKPAYHTVGTVEVLGQLGEDERLLPTATRPRPFSEIFIFPDHRLNRFLGIDGDFYLGYLSGHPNVRVHAQSKNKNFLPRNLGVFGTVGSGKSNTAQVLAEEAIAAGWAVLLIDVEGEYVRMNEPTTDRILTDALHRSHHRHPQGIDNFKVYVPSSGRSMATSSIPFKVPISALYPEIIADILEFSEAETRVYAMITAQATRLYASEDPAESVRPSRPFDLQQLCDGLLESSSLNGPANIRLLPMAHEHDITTAGVLRSKLNHLGRSDILDWRGTAHVLELPVEDILMGGRLSVLDVSETDDRSRNIAITYVLQELFKYVTTVPMGRPLSSGVPRPPLLVIIEEVHTFVSRAAAPKMRAVLDSLQTISRRGRKRWMALALVSQQPNHVPDEVFELTNTRIIHQIRSPVNMEPLKRTTAGVDETLWSNVSTMGPGQCLITGATFKKPLLINVRPAQSCRLHAS